MNTFDLFQFAQLSRAMKPKAPSLADHPIGSTRRRAERSRNWDFSHLAPAPDNEERRPTAQNRRRIDARWDGIFTTMRTGRPCASTKAVDRRWDQVFARSRGTR